MNVIIFMIIAFTYLGCCYLCINLIQSIRRSKAEKYSKSRFLDRIEELDNTINKGNLFSPPISGNESIVILKDYLLGEDWYSYNPISQEQINTEIIHEILMKYSRRYRKERKQMRKIYEKK